MSRRWFKYSFNILILLSTLLFSEWSFGGSSYTFSADLFHDQYTSSERIFFRSDQVPSGSSNIALNVKREKVDSGFNIDFQYLFSSGESSHNVNSKEIYYEFSWLNLDLSLGQKKHLWSRGDELWDRGLWQPRFFWNKLHPVQQGLMGVHVSKQVGSSKFLILGSPLFIPELGPNFEHKSDGSIFSASPWFRPPPKTSVVSGAPNQTNTNVYTLKMPKTEDIILNPSAALMWSWQGEEAFASASYAYKPMNQIQSAALGVLSIPTKTIDLQINPQLVYHHISTIEGGIASSGGWHYWVSATYDDPFENNHPSNWISQQQNHTTIVTGYVGYDFSEDKDTSHIYGSYSHVEGGDGKDKGDLATDTSYFDKRYQYLKSIRLGYKKPLGWAWGRPLASEFSLTYDSDQKGTVFTGQAHWQYQEKLSFNFRADLMGLMDNTSAPVSGRFIQNFRANDNLQLGVSYVF